MRQLPNVLLPEFGNLMSASDVTYFSLTVFDEGNVSYSDCTHDKWLSYYKEHYAVPPVQEKIMNFTKGVIVWEPNGFSPEINDFIKIRNEFCETKVMMTLILSKKERKIALSVGTHKEKEQLFDFYDKRKQVFDEQFRHILLLDQIRHNPVS